MNIFKICRTLPQFQVKPQNGGHNFLSKIQVKLYEEQGFKKRSRSRLDYVKVFAISVDTDITTLNAVAAM
jgi:hypothetical protein